MAVQSTDIAEMLESDWSPDIRAGLEADYRRAVTREQLLERMTEERKRSRPVLNWQRQSLSEFRKLFALNFEVTAWLARNPRPLAALDTYNDLAPKFAGMRKRMRRARGEADDGCALQTEWLAKHAELIDALEEAEEARKDYLAQRRSR